MVDGILYSGVGGNVPVEEEAVAEAMDDVADIPEAGSEEFGVEVNLLLNKTRMASLFSFKVMEIIREVVQ